MIFIKLHSNVPLSELVCKTHDSAMQTQSQGHTLNKVWNSAAGDMAVLQTAVLSHNSCHAKPSCVLFHFSKTKHKLFII